ncbi:MAG: hypothetical protein Q9217_003210 [Psora testacea]
MNAVPAGKPPPGVTPNFVDPPSLAGAIVTVSAVMMVWTLSFVTMRLYANYHASRGLGVDDCKNVVVGQERVISIDQQRSRRALDNVIHQRSYAQGMVLGPTLFFAKSAIFLLYLRIFMVNNTMRYAIWFGLACTFVLYWINIPFESWNCAPRAGQSWGLATVGKTCADNIMFGLVQGVLSVALDLYIFVLPIPIVLGLHMTMKRRLAILSIFGTAILTCENYVAIIVSSMPALASFSKGKIPGVSLLASMRSRFLSSKFSGSSPSKASASSGTSNADREVPHHPAMVGLQVRESGYLEIRDGRKVDQYQMGPVKTDIWGPSRSPRRMEEGVVRKNVDLHQSVQEDEHV